MKKMMFLSMLLAVCMFQTPAFANELLGAGATFPYPYYSKLFDTYHKSKRVETNYQAIGSSAGYANF